MAASHKSIELITIIIKSRVIRTEWWIYQLVVTPDLVITVGVYKRVSDGLELWDVETDRQVTADYFKSLRKIR